MKQHHGNIPVVMFYESSGKKVLLAEENWVTDEPNFVQQLIALLGNGNVIFK